MFNKFVIPVLFFIGMYWVGFSKGWTEWESWTAGILLAFYVRS